MSVRAEIKELSIPNDSLGMLDMLLDIEDEYDIVITDADAASITNLDDLADIVERKINEKERTEI
jgi:acyl carrier protein